MSRLNDLIRELKTREPALALDLEREVAALAERRAFGLNFERHVPEAVELAGRKVRKGDKVRILPSRGQLPKQAGRELWRVLSIDRSARTAKLESLAAPASSIEPTADMAGTPSSLRVSPLDELIVVAEFRDSIYPGLVSTGKVEKGRNKPFHTVINAENFHALQTLLFTHRGRVDCIYIDPPYNTGARDWKYNNDYVEGDDLYRHSKWLAFMERRLLLAKELLNPDDSVLIVTIDEKEYLRLGLLLGQTFPEANIQMISSIINPKGQSRRDSFSRTDEYIFFAAFGSAQPTPCELSAEWRPSEGTTTLDIRWQSLRRAGLRDAVRRADRPNLFFPIFVYDDGTGVHSVGEPIALDAKASNKAPTGTTAVWPKRSDGSDGRWQVSHERVRELVEKGFLRAPQPQASSILYLKAGEAARVDSGYYEVIGKRKDGSVETAPPKAAAVFLPGTQWRVISHNAGVYGTSINNSLIPGRVFPFPKSLYAVEDALRFFVKDKPDALILDFFAGSGTTAHAVMRLNKQDGGRRISVIVTNNEVAANEQKTLREKGLRPGDPEWEQWGICEYITKPRVESAMTGRTPDGKRIRGDYQFTDEFPMAEGFEQNVEFFTLTYEAPLRVASNREFNRIAPLLWLRAGSRGRRIDDISTGWDVADVYGVLADLDYTQPFLKAVSAHEGVGIAFIVTDEERLFESVAQKLPDHVEPVRLYEAYLRNFEIESGRGAL